MFLLCIAETGKEKEVLFVEAGKGISKKWKIGLTILITVLIAYGAYFSEFHYVNTEEGRLLMVEEYLPRKEENPVHGIGAEAALEVIAYQEIENRLFLFYKADNEANVHGIMQLERGINGRYRPVNASVDPFPFTAGVYVDTLTVDGTGESYLAIAGENCEEIAEAGVTFRIYSETSGRAEVCQTVYSIDEANFLRLIKEEEVKKELGVPGRSFMRTSFQDVSLRDLQGTDVTDQYRLEDFDLSWGGSIGSAERSLVYFLVGILLIIGGLITYFFYKEG